jgi:hypothetical protein
MVAVTVGFDPEQAVPPRARQAGPGWPSFDARGKIEMATASKSIVADTRDVPMFAFGEEYPVDWQPNSAYSLELFYQCQGAVMEFSYKERFFSGAAFAVAFDDAFRSAAVGEAITAATLERELGKFVSAEVLVKELDLKVRENCTVTIRATEDQELTWRKSPEPIMTKNQDRSHLYFGLRMIDANGDAHKPRYFPDDGVCKQISFGARVLPDWFPVESHPFGLHLKAMSCVVGEDLVDINIDPDIKNPSA